MDPLKWLKGKFAKPKVDPAAGHANKQTPEIFESELLKKDPPNLSTLSKEDVSACFKAYSAEYAAQLTLFKDYLKKAEEKIEAAKKLEDEAKELKAHNEKYQKQLKQITEENDKTIQLNNEQKEKIAALQNEIAGCKANEEELGELDKVIENKDKLIAEYEQTKNKNINLLNNYEKKFDELEGELQLSGEKLKKANEQLEAQKNQVEKANKEMEYIRQANEKLALEKAGEETTFLQERMEFKKAVSMNEKNISHLVKEKATIEQRLVQERERVERFVRKTVSREAQTDIAGGMPLKSDCDKDNLEKLQTRLKAKEEELMKSQNYAATLSAEFNKVKDKNHTLQISYSKNEKKLEETEKHLKASEDKNKKLEIEISELAKRREAASKEIAKLLQQVSRQSSKGPRSDAGDNSRVGRTSSEAVISSAIPVPRTSVEKDLILNTKKELETLYKELIKSIFSDTKGPKAEEIKAGGVVEHMLTRVIEKLADYCDDNISLAQKSYLVVKKKPAEETKKGTPLLQPPGQLTKSQEAFAARKPVPTKVGIYARSDKMDLDMVKSPTRVISSSGPVRVMRDPTKDK